MPIEIHAPRVLATTRETPADAFLRAPEKLVLAITYPTYFDKIIDDPGCKIRSPLPISKVPPVDPKSTNSNNAKFEVSYELTRIPSPKHVFGWIIELPPDPVNRWVSTQTKTAEEIVELIKRINKVTTTPLDNAVGNYRVELVCRPSPQSFYAHILNHEMQHAADFHWLIGAIFGRWVAWRDNLALMNDCGFKITQLDETFKWILAGGDFGAGDPQKYLEAYLKATEHTGALFHKTAKGASAVIRFHQAINDLRYGKVAQFDISASVSMANDNLTHNSPPHAHFKVPNVYDIASENTEVVTALQPSLPQGAPKVSQMAITLRETSDVLVNIF